MSRSIICGVCGRAVRRDAMRFDPVRDVAALEAGQIREARALTATECLVHLALLDDNRHAVQKDLPDLVPFLLGTGVRLGEAIGVGWDDVDLNHRVVHIRRTVIRLNGGGLVAKPPKTRSGVRTLRLPAWLVEVLQDRERVADLSAPIFPDALGGYRHLSSVERDFPQARLDTPSNGWCRTPTGRPSRRCLMAMV